MTTRNDDNREPVLPPELERKIFELVAKLNPGMAVCLALVSRRVQLWMEDYLYSTITLSTPELCQRLLYTIDTRPPSFFAEHVKSLCVPGDISADDAFRVLTVCQGVVNLAYWIDRLSRSNVPHFHATHFHAISSLRPKLLSINVGGLFGSSESLDFTHPFFSQVTHLEVVDWQFSSMTMSLELLSSLTHLAVDIEDMNDMDHLRRIFNDCKRLRVLLCLVKDDQAVINLSWTLSTLDIDDDGRVVVFSDSEVLENWENSVNGSSDNQWTFAEALVEEKQKQLHGCSKAGT